MATYQDIRGMRVKYLSADPSNTAAGEVWYNSTTGTLRSRLSTAAWSSGSPITTARFNMGSGDTPNTAAIIFGGTGSSVLTEEFDGSGWSAGGNMGTSRNALPGFGTQTTAVAAGGYQDSPAGNVALVEEYDGSSWSEVNNIPTAQRGSASFGALTAGVIAGGFGATANLTTSYEYDGTNWTSGGALPTGTDRTEGAGCGALTAGLIAAGDTRVAFEYDGTNWTNGGTTNSDHDGGADTGIQTSAVIFGGFPSPGSGQQNSTETYDGTSFSTSPATMASGRYGMGKGGSSGTAAVAGGGDTNPGTLASTEEYNFEANVITAAAWATSPALSYSVDGNLAGSGSLTSAVAAGGYNAPAGPGLVSYVASAATWNGTAWSNITDMPARRTSCSAVGATAPAFYIYGGINQPGPTGPSTSYLTTTDTWNGSSWGSGPALAEAQSNAGSAGTPSAIVMMGGAGPPGTNGDNIQQYNGSWASSPVNYPTLIQSLAGVGTETAAVFFGGTTPAEPAGTKATNEWNGASISAGGDMNLALQLTSGSGTQTAALSYGGRLAGSKNAIGMVYDGTAWATSPNLGTARDAIALGPMGSTTNALATSGSGGAGLVEEFTGETSAVNIETLTTS